MGNVCVWERVWVSYWIPECGTSAGLNVLESLGIVKKNTFRVKPGGSNPVILREIIGIARFLSCLVLFCFSEFPTHLRQYFAALSDITHLCHFEKDKVYMVPGPMRHSSLAVPLRRRFPSRLWVPVLKLNHRHSDTGPLTAILVCWAPCSSPAQASIPLSTGTRTCLSAQLWSPSPGSAVPRPLTSKVTGGIRERRWGDSGPSCSKALTCGQQH